MKVGFNGRNGSAAARDATQTLHLAQAQTRVSVPHQLAQHQHSSESDRSNVRIALLHLRNAGERESQCGTDTLVCAGEARQDCEKHYGFDSFGRNSVGFPNGGDASPSPIARTVSAIAPAGGRRLARFGAKIGGQTEGSVPGRRRKVRSPGPMKRRSTLWSCRYAARAVERICG